MTDSNIQPPTTDTGTNPVPGTEVTTSPGLVPETVPAYDPNTANVDIAVTTEDNPSTTVVPPSVTGTEWDGTIPPDTSDDYAAAVDHQVNTMPISTESPHQALMQDPVYAVATHEHQLNKIADMLEELCARVVRIEEKISEHENDHLTAGSDNPIKDYPEVAMHGGAPGLTK